MIVQPSAFQQRANILQRDPPVDVREGSVDHLLQLGRTQKTRAGERQEMPPRFSREATAFMRTQHPETHQAFSSHHARAHRPPSGSAGAAYYNVIRRATRPGETGRRPRAEYPEVTGRANLARRCRRGKRHYRIHNSLPVKGLGIDNGVGGCVPRRAALQEMGQFFDRIAA